VDFLLFLFVLFFYFVDLPIDLFISFIVVFFFCLSDKGATSEVDRGGLTHRGRGQGLGHAALV
jgi:hypothetical protein